MATGARKNWRLTKPLAGSLDSTGTLMWSAEVNLETCPDLPRPKNWGSESHPLEKNYRVSAGTRVRSIARVFKASPLSDLRHLPVISPFLSASTFFLTLPLRFSNLEVSIEVALLLEDFPGLASGLIIHHDDFPVPSF